MKSHPSIDTTSGITTHPVICHFYIDTQGSRAVSIEREDRSPPRTNPAEQRRPRGRRRAGDVPGADRPALKLPLPERFPRSEVHSRGEMLVQIRFLLPLLLLLLGGPRTGLPHKLHKAEPVLGCLNAALSEAKESRLEAASPLGKRSSLYLPGQGPSSGEKEEEEDKEKRIFSVSGGRGGAGSPRYKYLSQAQLKGKLYQDKAKSDRRTKFTLSLDVPTNIMNILFNIAKAKNLQAKAAANAHLMAQVGRKK
ncbi:urocortin-3 [Lemur catta]|uniref:urocortin-3 n=1 Tax=Lemur catta TaxID=9447 RepID=UPI001E26A99E|nr:urocortin-3 [Lemur catta]